MLKDYGEDDNARGGKDCPDKEESLTHTAASFSRDIDGSIDSVESGIFFFGGASRVLRVARAVCQERRPLRPRGL